jgi:hypothetical protein
MKHDERAESLILGPKVQTEYVEPRVLKNGSDPEFDIDPTLPDLLPSLYMGLDGYSCMGLWGGFR